MGGFITNLFLGVKVFYKNLGRKGKIFWNALFFGVVFASLGMFVVLGSALDISAEYEADDFFVDLIENKADLTYGYAVFELYNPTSSDLSLDSFDVIINEYAGDSVKKVEVLIFQNVTDSSNVTDYKVSCQSQTSENGTESQVCDRVPSGWHWDNRTEERWVSFDDFTFRPETRYKIKIIGHWNPALGFQSREWFPKITVNDVDFVQEKWEWWNSTWNYKKQINITNNDAIDYDFLPVCFDLNHEGHGLSNCQDIRIVNENSVSELEYYGYHPTDYNSTHCYMCMLVNLTASSTFSDLYAYYVNSSPVSWTNTTWDTVNDNIDSFEDGDYTTPYWNMSENDQTEQSRIMVDTEQVKDEGNSLHFDDPDDYDNSVDPLVYSKFFDRAVTGGDKICAWVYITIEKNYRPGFYLYEGSTLCAGIRGDTYPDQVKAHWGGSQYYMYNVEDNTWHKWCFEFDNNSQVDIIVYENNGNVADSYTNKATGCTAIERIRFDDGDYTAHDSYFDNITWRLNPATEPTVVLGSEKGKTEIDYRNAIKNGIQDSEIGPSAPIYEDQKLYERSTSNYQNVSRFDIITASGNQRWGFNYVDNDTDYSMAYMQNMTPSLYIMEISYSEGLSCGEVETKVEELINATNE